MDLSLLLNNDMMWKPSSSVESIVCSVGVWSSLAADELGVEFG